MVLEDIVISENTVNVIMLCIWLLIFLIALIIEMTSMGLTSIWFCGGALVALIFTYIPGVPFYVEIIVFFLVSIISLVSLGPLARKLLLKHRKDNLMNIDAIVGQKGIILKKIDELNDGEVRIKSTIWTAICQNQGEVIDLNETVEVIGVIGNKLIVKKIESEED